VRRKAAYAEEFAALAGRLRREREYLSLSQGDVAWHASVTSESVRRWESGSVWPSSLNLVIWARVVDLRVVLVNAQGQACSSEVERREKDRWVDWEVRRLVGVLAGRRGIGTERLAMLAGVGPRSIHVWEQEGSVPPTDGLLAWSAVLGCSVRLVPMDWADRRGARSADGS
jgi:DNA-binding transcriptional regulator YiaG